MTIAIVSPFQRSLVPARAGHENSNCMGVCFCRRKCPNDLAVMHDDEPVAHLKKFVEIFGNKKDRGARLPGAREEDRAPRRPKGRPSLALDRNSPGVVVAGRVHAPVRRAGTSPPDSSPTRAPNGGVRSPKFCSASLMRARAMLQWTDIPPQPE